MTAKSPVRAKHAALVRRHRGQNKPDENDCCDASRPNNLKVARQCLSARALSLGGVVNVYMAMRLCRVGGPLMMINISLYLLHAVFFVAAGARGEMPPF